MFLCFYTCCQTGCLGLCLFDTGTGVGHTQGSRSPVSISHCSPTIAPDSCCLVVIGRLHWCSIGFFNRPMLLMPIGLVHDHMSVWFGHWCLFWGWFPVDGWLVEGFIPLFPHVPCHVPQFLDNFCCPVLAWFTGLELFPDLVLLFSPFNAEPDVPDALFSDAVLFAHEWFLVVIHVIWWIPCLKCFH